MHTKEETLDTWISRSLGRITANVNITDERQEEEIDVLSALDDIKTDREKAAKEQGN